MAKLAATLIVASLAVSGRALATPHEPSESPPAPARPAAATPAKTKSAAPSPEAKDDGWTIGSFPRLDLAGHLGLVRRLDQPPLFPLEQATSLSGGFDVRVFLAHRVAISLGWERFGIGRETTGVTAYGEATIARSADALWLGLRLDPLRSERLALFLAIGGGAAWQRATALGSAWPALQPGQSMAFECSGSGSLAPGLRVDLGGEAVLGDGVRAFVSGGFGVFNFGDRPLDDCSGGAGSTQTINGHAGISYSFDLTGRAPDGAAARGGGG